MPLIISKTNRQSLSAGGRGNCSRLLPGRNTAMALRGRAEDVRI
jgi:hypothetical protein